MINCDCVEEIKLDGRKSSGWDNDDNVFVSHTKTILLGLGPTILSSCVA
jgi:hypothetical protein